MRAKQWLILWLGIGVFMVFMQIIIGGITRLTGSGLSITRWEIVTGTIPPLGEEQWQQEFDEYRKTPQYQRINRGMGLSEFKYIYFWEYFHRLWARAMGFVFLIPFIVFWRKGLINNWLMKRLGITIALAALAASFGWIMVQSGLIEKPWVSPYKLSLHLMIGIAVYAWLLWTFFLVLWPAKKSSQSFSPTLRFGVWIAAILTFQLWIGGLMSGMKAALFYPTWPGMYGSWLPEAFTNASSWSLDAFVHYDQNVLPAALVNFFHRNIAFLISILIVWYIYRLSRKKADKNPVIVVVLLPLMLFVQVLLGIVTIMHSTGKIPVALGVAHQAGAILLLSALLLNIYFEWRSLRNNNASRDSNPD